MPVFWVSRIFKTSNVSSVPTPRSTVKCSFSFSKLSFQLNASEKGGITCIANRCLAVNPALFIVRQAALTREISLTRLAADTGFNMPCFKPLPAWQFPLTAAFGPRPKLKFVFTPHWNQIEVPCGQCIGCRLDKSRTWAARCMHEAHMHDSNLFLTLTYNDSNLPIGSEGRTTINKRDLQLFWKRMRKAGFDLRYYAVGEYGDNTGRPHYHAIAFGLLLSDLRLYTRSNGFNLYTSAILDKIWGLGNCWVGDVTFESCAYVARYVMKKLTGNHARLYEHEGILPEFALMSRGNPSHPDSRFHGGIGSSFYSRYKSDMLPHDNTFIRGSVRISTPRYYLNKFSLSDPTSFNLLKQKRVLNALEHAPENTPDRRIAREEVKLHKLKMLLRSFE